MSTNSTSRFSNRVEDYVKYRPNYPQAIIPLLQEKYQITSDKLIADIGAGTGISSELFLDGGYRVVGIEPNKEMRDKSLALLGDRPNFSAKDGTAEATSLDARSVDVIVAGQAFHWFDRQKTKAEFRRILKEGGKIVLLWNERLTQSLFEAEYDQFIVMHSTDYTQVDHRNIDEIKIKEFFEPGTFKQETLPNWQIFDFDGLKGRLLSSSYIPSQSEPGYEGMMNDLYQLFNKYQVDNQIRINYETKIYIGSFKG